MVWFLKQRERTDGRGRERAANLAQFETKFKPLGMRLRGLVPIESKDIKNIRRVPGVGISGLLDIKI